MSRDINDFNGNVNASVFAPVQYFAADGTRYSSARSFLNRETRNSRTKNLHVVTGAHVTKVLINGRKKAVGVRYDREGRVLTAMAAKEVVLCAGAVATPQLLMLSGEKMFTKKICEKSVLPTDRFYICGATIKVSSVTALRI